MNKGRHLVLVWIVLAMAGWAMTASATIETTPDLQPADSKTGSREPVLGVGYHPGNFIGPLAFDVIVHPLRHFALDVQVGYWSLENDVRGLGLAPQAQWEFLRGWETPYAGLAFRYEEVWSDGVTAASKGGALTGGWQFRWHSGLGVLVGAGVVYKTAVNVNSPRTGYYSSGGTSGTYEIGIRYFF
jgi:hypothetical protein